MWNETIFPDDLKSFDYYKRKLPIYLRQCPRFIEHFRIWYDILVGDESTEYSGIIPSADALLYLLNIFDSEYLSTINNMSDSSEGTVSFILDDLAALFGISRECSITYTDSDETIHENEQLTLDNNDLLIYIKCQIIRNYCDGTAEQIEQLYRNAGLLVYVITTTQNATAHLYLANISGATSYSQNIQKLFLSGALRIESMGVAYEDSSQELTEFLIWDTEDTALTWGKGVWSV